MKTKSINSQIVELTEAAGGGRIVEHYPAPEDGDGTECVVVSIRMPAEFPQVITADGMVIGFGSGTESMKLAKNVAEAISQGMMQVEKWQTARRWMRSF